MEYEVGAKPGREELGALYGRVGWDAYTADLDALHRAVAGSTFVATARDASATLVGLARALSDDVSIVYLQDVLVRPEHQRSGVGRRLVELVLERYAHTRQKVLLTDDDPGQHAFYRSLGYLPAAEVDGGPLGAFVRLDGD